MKTIYFFVLVVCLMGLEVFCMNQPNNNLMASLNRQAAAVNIQQTARFAVTQQHYAQQSAIITQQEKERQEAQKRADDPFFLNKK